MKKIYAGYRIISIESLEKITSRYGGKGVVSIVKPDSEMPLVVNPNTGKEQRVEVVNNIAT